MVAIAFEIFGY